MQEVLYADTVKEGTKPSDKAMCARAYDVLEERRRIIRMKPKPRDAEVPVGPRKPKTPVPATFADPTSSERVA
jgi:hypothetical protein